jgi:F0F1-type ATP synthase assembly protein I
VNITVNYLAVVVAAAIGFILGWIWYTPLFGKQWMAARGVTPEQVADGQKNMARNMIVVALGILIMSWALSVFANYTHLVTWMQGVKLGALAWFGFAFTLGLIDAVMTSGRKASAFYIDAAYWLITLVIIGVTVSVWH